MAQRKIIILVSGEIASGKTTLAHKFEEKFGFKVLKTREAIINLAKKKLKGLPPDRTFMQNFGTALDKKDEGRWVLDYFQNDFDFSIDNTNFFVVDAIRILNQIKHFRKAYSFTVIHKHLTA